MYTTGKRKIGLYGGSFNPIHVGHITLAKRLMEVAGLDEVWMMVSPQNPFKANDTLLADDLRLAMTRKALEGETHIVACDYEFHLPKPSYTWNTLQALGRDCPDCEFTLLIGGDNWQAFDRWFRGEDIVDRYRVVVYPAWGRGGCCLVATPRTACRHAARQCEQHGDTPTCGRRGEHTGHGARSH